MNLKLRQNVFFRQSAFCFAFLVASQRSRKVFPLKTTFKRAIFSLFTKTRQPTLLIAEEDFKVAQIAANDLTSDVERVTGKKPEIIGEIKRNVEKAVIICTLGKSPLIDSLTKNAKIEIWSIQNKWESFLIQTVQNPLPNVKTALVIVGSDRRGTAFGVDELSQIIGVSPWYWWADVAPEPRANLVVSRARQFGGEPSIKYRGIFLNDEDWGLQPWAAKTLDVFLLY